MTDEYCSSLIARNRELETLELIKDYFLKDIELKTNHRLCRNDMIYTKNNQVIMEVLGIRINLHLKPFVIEGRFKYLQLMLIYDKDENKELIGSLFLNHEGKVFTESSEKKIFSEIGTGNLAEDIIEFCAHLIVISKISCDQNFF